MHNSSSNNTQPRSFTILRPAHNRLQARKVIRPDGTIIGADNIRKFKHKNISFKNIYELFPILQKLQKENAAVIRGMAACQRQPLIRQLAHRHYGGKSRGDEGFLSAEKSWIAIDIDDFVTPDLVTWTSNPEAAIDHIISILPEPYCDCSYIWQLTASHGLDTIGKKWSGGFCENKIRCRIWMMLDRSINDHETKALLSIIKSFIPEVDLALSRPVQLIYTARPILEENPDIDPLGKINVPTMGLVEREYDELPIIQDLQEKLRWSNTSNADPILHVNHPNVEAAIRSIGMPLQGISGRGSIRDHLFSAIMKIAFEDKTLNAKQISESILFYIKKYKPEIQINLMTHQRHWEEVDDYLEVDVIRISQWCIDRLKAPPKKAADGAGARKKIRKINILNPDKTLLISAEEARNEMKNEFNSFEKEVMQWLDELNEHKLKIRKYLSLSEEDKEFTYLPPMPEAICKLISVTTGIGKSLAIRNSSIEIIKHLRHDRKTHCVIIAVPRYDLAEEYQRKFKDEHDVLQHGIKIQILRGREQNNPKQIDEKMCLRINDVKEIQRLSLRVTENLCYRKSMDEDPIKCPYFNDCGYIEQQIEADIYIIVHENLFYPPIKIIKEVAVVFIDETPLLKGLWGINAPLVEIPVDRLRKSDTVPNDLFRLDQAMLMDIRHRLISCLDTHENESLSYGKLIETGLTADLLKAAQTIEWSRKVDASNLKINPQMSSECLWKALRLAKENADVRKLILLYEALEYFLSQCENSSESCGTVELIVRDNIRILRISGKRSIHKKWQVPTLIADATSDMILLQSIWPNIIAAPKHRVKEPHVEYYQVVDRSFANKAIAPPNKKEEMRLHEKQHQSILSNVKKLRAALVKASLPYSHGKVLAVMPKETKAAILTQGPLPSWLNLAHHGAVAGLDKYGNVDAVFVIGRPLPRCNVTSRIAAALTGISPACDHYAQTTGQIIVEDGVIEVICFTHPDPIAELVRRQITEASLLQAIGRGRGVNRGSDSPLIVHIWTDIPLSDLCVVKPILWDDIKANIEDEMLASGAWLSNAEDARRAHPKLIKSAVALRKERERQSATFAYKDILYSKCHGLLQVSYRRALERSGASFAVFIKDLIPDARSWLERILGPLAHFEILQANVENGQKDTIIKQPLPISQKPLVEQEEIRRALEIFNAFANLHTVETHEVTAQILNTARTDSIAFMKRWQSDAIHLGWTSESLFALPKNNIQGGLAFQLDGDEVIELHSYQAITNSGTLINSSVIHQ